MIKIDIISDAVCPWCFIGKKRLDEALNKFKNHNILYRLLNDLYIVLLNTINPKNKI